MEQLFATLASGVAAFTLTNLDDLLLLSSLFMDVELSATSIIIGQFMGMTILVLVSVVAALLAFAIPYKWLALLGFVPVFLGMRRLWKWWTGCQAKRALPEGEFVSPKLVQGVNSPYAIWTVTVLTIANGGDNLSVYIPLFSMQLEVVPIYLAIFVFLTGVWCGLGYYITNHRVLREWLRMRGKIVIPLVLIGMGLKVFGGAGLR